MNRTTLMSAALGIVFGILLAWSQMTSAERIHDMLRLHDPYLFLVLFSAMPIGMAGAHLLRARKFTTVVSRERVNWVHDKVERRHITGSIIFGLGWSLSQSCPGPIAAQLGGGAILSAATIAGIAVGVTAHARRPATRQTPSAAQPSPAST